MPTLLNQESAPKARVSQRRHCMSGLRMAGKSVCRSLKCRGCNGWPKPRPGSAPTGRLNPAAALFTGRIWTMASRYAICWTLNPSLESSSHPLPEFLRITRTMKNRQDGECSVFDGEVNAVTGKPLQTNLASLLTNLWKMFRIDLRMLQRALDLQDELSPQTGALFFMPRNGLNKLGARRWFESDRTAHFHPKRLLRSALTCSQGIPSRGLVSKSAKRRSSSAACSGVRSGSYSSSVVIPKMSCASLILSSCGRAFAASRISVALMLQKYPRFAGRQATNLIQSFP